MFIYKWYLKILFIYKWYLKIYFVLKWFQILLIYIAYMQGELNISSIYRFILSVSCIKELDIFSLCDTLCKGSLTSPLMHCILCFMWVRVLSSLLHVMHVCRGANLLSSSSWMYITYISLLLICFSPLCWWLTKRGRMILSLMILRLYMHILSFMHVLCFIFIQKGGEWFLKV